MNNMLYLLNMRVAGIKSLKEEIRLDFYKKTVDKNFDPDKYRIKAIYGENGSGKSAIITAVSIFQHLVMYDNYLNESKTQVFLDEIINKTTKKFKFSCEFLADIDTAMLIYDYSIEVGKNDVGLYEIQSEVLKTRKGHYANKNYKKIFESKNGELLYIKCNDTERKILEKKSLNLLLSKSFIDIYITNVSKNSEDFIDAKPDKELLIHMLMCSTLLMVIKVYLGEEDQHELYFLRKRIKEGELDNQVLQDGLFEYGEFANIFSSVNEKIVEKKYFEDYRNKVERLTQFIKIFKPDLVSIDIDAKEKGDQYECELNLNYGDYSINREFESTGIKKLIRLFDCFIAASTVGIVFVDEMDSNLNDVYLCKLLEYFMYYGQGQLCFTTHNLDPMAILKENRNSIDFLSSDNHLVPWTSRGNASPENCYKNGMIENSPFNIDATDFVGILGE
ncbi:MAG: AAA family ATPase [Lachnospiraceae bacterium]|nr:AAA family ATPase [Lachnospiraceae bacterium]